eukprot:g11740.t1
MSKLDAFLDELVKVHMQQLDPEATVEVEQAAPVSWSEMAFVGLSPGRKQLSRAVSLRERPGRHVASLAFAMTCAGPFGVEERGAAGRYYAGRYVLPQIFMTCELSMMPPLSNRGVVTWISRAFGGKAGECIGLNMLLYQIVDLATYTTVIVGYAESAGYEVHSGLPAIAPLLAISVGLCVNLLAVEMAAEVFMGVLALVLLPFLLGLRWSVPSLLGTNFWSGATVTQPSKDWNLFFSSLIWLNTGWDSFGNLAEEQLWFRTLLQPSFLVLRL